MSRPNKANKISEKELLRQRIRDYGIVFEGPRPSQQWPSHYAGVFSKIHNIDRVRFDEYRPDENRGLLAVAQVKDRVVTLNEIAYHLRQNRENEQTWRLQTEPLIMSRFNSEVEW
jgi:hypothetical protein